MAKRDWRLPVFRLRWWAARLLTPRRAVYSRGVTFTLQCDNWITHFRWQSYNTKEPETLDWIDTWVKDGDSLFDIGANIGVYALYAAMRHPGVRVIAFEPEYANLHLLRDNIVENGLQERVDVYSVALSNRSGVGQLYIQDFTPGSALHTESREAIHVTRSEQRVVWREGVFAITLDRFCEETGLEPNAIKIDVDGTEQEVLEGAQQTLRSLKLRSMILEMPRDSRVREACEGLLLGAGLRREWRDQVGKSPREVWARAYP